MTENQLHRCGELLEYNIRIVFIVKQLPACPELEFPLRKPLNTSQPARLAQVQKLLSVGGRWTSLSGHRTAEHPLRHIERGERRIVTVQKKH